jgi:hypothetical protein
MSRRALESPDGWGRWARIAGFAAAVTAVGCGGDSSSADGEDDDESGSPETGTDEADSGSATADESGDSTGEPPPPAVEPAPAGMRRLLRSQYVRTVDVLLGPEAAAVADPPVDQPIQGFDAIGAREVPLSPVAIEQYEDIAIEIGKVVIEHPETLAQTVPCVVDGPQDFDCYAHLAADFGRVAWRRELSNDEITKIIGVAQQAKEWADGDFMRGVQYAVATIIQSPDFIYAVELGEETEGDYKQLTRDELMTRMSLFVLGRAPDAALFARSDAGELDDSSGIRAVAADMLEHADARASVSEFFDELLRIRDLPLKTKDPTLFPDYTPDLAQSMRTATLMLVLDVVFGEDGSFLRLYDADYTFVDAPLAEFYGIPEPAAGFERVDTPAGQRRLGLLTEPALLAALGHPDRNSPTRRGVFVQRTLLCNEVPPPPGDVDTTLPEPTEATTLRALMEQHMDKGDTCAGCHVQMDPVGFAFEYYDSSGKYRELDNGYPVDGSGTIDGLGSWEDAAGLALLVRDDVRLAPCLVRNVYRNALGTIDDAGQADALAFISEAFADSDHSFKQLVIELAANPAFRQVGDPQ